MNIALATPIDISIFSSYFDKNTDKDRLVKLAYKNDAPALITYSLELLKAGHRLKIFTLCTENAILKSDYVELYLIKEFSTYPQKYLWGSFVNANNIKKVIQENINGIEVLHAHWTYEYGYAAKSFVDVLPTFCTMRDWPRQILKLESLTIKGKLMRFLKYRMSEMVLQTKNLNFISNSPYISNLLETKKKIQSTLIPNPIKESFFDGSILREKCQYKILSISSCNDRWKNMDRLFEAFSIVLKKQNPNIAIK